MKISELIDIQKNEKGYVDVILDISTAFAYDERVRKEVDKIYEANKYLYYNTAKQSRAYNGYGITMGGIINEVYTKRSLGIILCAENDKELTEKLLLIIKRYYFDIYENIKVNTEKGFMNLVKKISEENFIPAVNRMYEGFIIYLTMKLNNRKELICPRLYAYVEYYVDELSENYLADIEVNKLIKEKREMIDGIKERIFTNKGSYYGYEDLFNSSNEEIKKYTAIITAIFDFEKVSASRLLSSTQLSKNDIDELIRAYLQVYNDKNLERSSNVIVNGIIIKSMIKAYKDVRGTFIKNNKETLYFNMEEMEKRIIDLENENNILKQESLNSNKTIQILKAEKEKEENKLRKIYEKQISNLNKKLAETSKKLDVERSKSEELTQLRELFFDLKNDHILEKDNRPLSEYIYNKKVLVVGGIPEWRKKIKDKYNELLTLDGFNENFDIKILNNIEYIFFYVGCMNHATYYKIMNQIRSNKIPFGYIGKTNIELIETEIVDQLEKYFAVKKR